MSPVVDFSAGYAAGIWEPIWAEYRCNWRQLAFEHGTEPATWVLGDLALDGGAAGILFPSMVHTAGTNLVLFNNSAISAESLQVYDPARELLRDGRNGRQ